MATHIDKATTSEFFTEPQDSAFNRFTDFEELASSKYMTIVKARKNGRWFVLKALSKDYRGKSQYEMLLRKDFIIGFKFDHPNIVHYIDFVNVEPLGNCIQMDFIVGQSLDDYLETSRTLKEKKRIVLQLSAGMKAIHAEQVIHRDLKPENILITENGHNVKIIDFGFSDADSYSILKEPAGTEGFSSPEQMAGTLPLDNRADIYSLGIILKNLGLPFYYNKVIGKCIKEDREQRYKTIDDFVQAFCRQRWIFFSVTSMIVVIVGLVAVAVFHESPPSADTKRKTVPTVVSVKKEEATKNGNDSVVVVKTEKPTIHVSERTTKEESKEEQSPKASTEPTQSLNLLTAQLHEGIDKILNPYIEKRKAGINIAEHQTFMHIIERDMAEYKNTFFSRDDLGESTVILLQEYDRYFTEKMYEYGRAGKIRQLTKKERREIIRRHMSQQHKTQDSLDDKHRQGITDVQP